MARDRTARARVRQLLATGGPVNDSSGFATGMLKERINYQGSSVAFIQLIAAMEQDGEIAREIRGKRTYKISATARTEDTFRPVASIPPASVDQGTANGGGIEASIDYDKLAKALVREVWTLVAAVASSGAAGVQDMAETTMPEGDYAKKISAARQALDDLFNDVESKAKVGAARN